MICIVLLAISVLSIVYSGFHYVGGCCGHESERAKNQILLGGLGIFISLISMVILKISTEIEFNHTNILPLSILLLLLLSIAVSFLLHFISSYFSFKDISTHNKIEKIASYFFIFSFVGLFILAFVALRYANG